MEQIQKEQEEKRMMHMIRNFIEKIIEGLIDNVDDTSIDRLYENSECKYTLYIVSKNKSDSKTVIRIFF